jgi:cellobiose epimerase
MNLRILFIFLFLISTGCLSANYSHAQGSGLAEEIELFLRENLLATWYPKAIDIDSGGFFSNFSADFQIKSQQEKMIVTQARHLWSNAKAAERYPDVAHFRKGARHGFDFLKNKMWDHEHGGFFQMVDRSGNPLLERDAFKTAYGNSFAIFGLAAYFGATGDSAALHLAIQAFQWLEKNSHDPVHKGYFQHLEQNGRPILRGKDTPSTSDLGYKDQNSSIHLLEAFTELYQVWKNPLVRERLEEMHLLVRDVITDEKGVLTLYFLPDWTPISFKHLSEEEILKHKNLDHVSFGHDVETAFLLQESAEVLGWSNDPQTLIVPKRMLDHALAYGWDDVAGGFFDEGYYFKGEKKPRIIKDSKNWWAQAEGMNSLLVMSSHFPDDANAYYNKFEKLWGYIKDYLIDHQNGDWYAGGLDKQPELRSGDKGHIWKANYHQFRSMKHTVDLLNGKQVH